VNPQIITADKKGCEYILNRLYEDKKWADSKHSLQQVERNKLRQKLKERHNQTVELERNSGVKLGSLSKECEE
jgi:hypothetical protein